MKLDAAVDTIRTFWADFPLPQGAGDARLAELEAEFGMAFPPDAQAYVRDWMALGGLEFEEVDNPLTLYGADSLGRNQPGYSVNSVTNQPIADWKKNWFLIGDLGADPVIIDLHDDAGAVRTAMHGAGTWDFSPKADSIGQFILCAAAMHHALTKWGDDLDDDVIQDDDDGFNLADGPAAWLFPRAKEWAGDYYEDWCGVFDNH